ncbi:MAG: hypothetical protein DMG94_09105 [Acidobacteria bacterium]|nr:MAG: hypothetical protein DMG94_09105 [Acidobacteriota bacterium]
MATPLRKDRPQEQPTEDLTTADLAQGRAQNRPEPGEPKPMASERVSADSNKVQPIREEHDSTPLFPNNELENLRNRWKEVQTAFVDEPRRAVEQADGLVASAMKRLAEVFAEERSKLEKQWDRGDTVSTEDLRVALQRYRTFFHRLLSV